MKRVEDMTLKEISNYCKDHTCYQCDSDNTVLRYFCRRHFARAAAGIPCNWFDDNFGFKSSLEGK